MMVYNTLNLLNILVESINISKQLKKDKLKEQKCSENNYTLYRLKYNYSIEDFTKLCNNIKQIINNYENKEVSTRGISRISSYN